MPGSEQPDPRTDREDGTATGGTRPVAQRPLAGRYRLLSLIGQGGMGRVWLAHDELLGRDVAVKELVPPVGLTAAERQELRERAIHEARAIARLDQVNVVRIFDVLRDSGEPWIVMELVSGRSLHQEVEDGGPVAPERAATIGLGVLAALRAAHGAGLLHRDVKPANVLLASDGRVVLTDFGLAIAAEEPAVTRTGVVLGSLSYMAPERALDQPIGAAADLWSLGATLFAAVEGKSPYARSTSVATIAALATEPPAPPTRAGVLGPALAALLRRDPGERAGLDDAERLLRQAVSGQPSPGTPEEGAASSSSGPSLSGAPEAPQSATAPIAGRRRGRRLAAGVVAVVAVVVVAAALAGRPLVSNAVTDRAAGHPVPLIDVASAASSPSVSPAGPPAAPDTEPGRHVGPSRRGVAGAASGPLAVPASSPAAASRPASAGSGAPPTRATRNAPAQPVTPGRAIISILDGKCIDVPGGNAATTAPVQTWDCSGAAGQRFHLGGGESVQVLGRCLQVLGTGNGAPVGIGACTGSGAQRFNLNSSNDLVSLLVDRCVDVTDGSRSNGAALQIWDCTGSDNQKWKWAS
jgi:serine/threonine protein kinase